MSRRRKSRWRRNMSRRKRKRKSWSRRVGRGTVGGAEE
jgi:hypothetical protein